MVSRVVGAFGTSDADITAHYIVSGGFAIVQPDSQLSINAVEGFPLEDFSAEVCPISTLPALIELIWLFCIGGQITD